MKKFAVWEEMKLLIAKDVNLLREIFLMGEKSNFWLLARIFSIPRTLHIGSGQGGAVHTWCVQQFCDIFNKKGDAWHMILGDNPTGHGFVLRDLVLTEDFQISHNCVTECTLQAKFLLKFI